MKQKKEWPTFCIKKKKKKEKKKPKKKKKKARGTF